MISNWFQSEKWFKSGKPSSPVLESAEAWRQRLQAPSSFAGSETNLAWYFCPISLIPENVFFSIHVESIWFMSDIVKVWCENALSQSLWPKKQDLELFTGPKSLLTLSEPAKACFRSQPVQFGCGIERERISELIWDVPCCASTLSAFLFLLECVSDFCELNTVPTYW